MSHKKEIITAVGTLAIAVGIGFVMQRSEAAQERYGGSAPAPMVIEGSDAGEDILENVSADELIEVQSIQLTSATDVSPAVVAPVPVPQSEDDVLRVAVPTSDALAPPPVNDTAPQIADCEITATADAVRGGLAMLRLEAPCAPNERLTVHHNGLIVAHATDDEGNLGVLLPALTEDAVFIMAFANGDGAVAQVSIPDVAAFSRVAVQWRGAAGFELHAREFGAGYGEAGHIWSGGEVAEGSFLDGASGTLMRLGDTALADPLLAEVYTFASENAARDGLIDLTVEAEITDENCGREVQAQTFEMVGGALLTHDVTLSVPGCDVVGDFLVLNNLVTDMKVAAN